jgi:hypothetical protein
MLVTDGGPSSLTRYVRDDRQRSALRRSALRAVRRDTAVTAESAWRSAFAVRVAGSRRPAATARRCTSARVSGRAMASSSHSRRRREKNAHILRVPSSSRKVLRRYPRCPGLSTARAPASPVARERTSRSRGNHEERLKPPGWPPFSSATYNPTFEQLGCHLLCGSRRPMTLTAGGQAFRGRPKFTTNVSPDFRTRPSSARRRIDLDQQNAPPDRSRGAFDRDVLSRGAGYRSAIAVHWPDAVPLTVLMLPPSSFGAGLLPVQVSDPLTVLPASAIPVGALAVLCST